MTSRAGATNAQMAPLWRDSQQLRREAGASLRLPVPPALARGALAQGPLGQHGVDRARAQGTGSPSGGVCRVHDGLACPVRGDFSRAADWLTERLLRALR